MGLIDYGRNQKKRKEYIHQSGLLLAGVDVSKAKHDAGIGTLEGIRFMNAWVDEAHSAHLFLIGGAYCKLICYLKNVPVMPRNKIFMEKPIFSSC